MAAIAGWRPRTMACITCHLAILVSQLGLIAVGLAPGDAIFLDRLRQPRFLVVMRIARRNRIEYLHHFPLLVLIEHGALEKLASIPVKTAFAPWGAEPLEIGAARRGGCS